MIEWVLVMFLYNPALAAFEGTPMTEGNHLMKYSVLERCLAVATSKRLQSVDNRQYICWPSTVEETPV
jgi:hypothetical protein